MITSRKALIYPRILCKKLSISCADIRKEGAIYKMAVFKNWAAAEAKIKSDAEKAQALADQFAELASAIRDGLPPRAAVKEAGLPLAVYESLQKICWD
jgi:hypothetical protein